MLLTLKQRFAFFICIAIIGFLISSFIGGFLLSRFPDSTAAMRIAAVCQSVFQLIVPSIVTALIVTRNAASFLTINRGFKFPILLLSFLALLFSVPAMNYIINLNQHFNLPESFSWLENSLRTMEENAARSISLLQGGHSVGNLILNILIIGVLAGFGEELFFRGTLQRLMITGHVNHHVAIWTTAVIFSAMHLQFFGFIPRVLLGAYFGYLLYWSGSIWLPMAIHALNNTIYVVGQWVYNATSSGESTPIDTIGADGNMVAVVVSVIITSAMLYVIRLGIEKR